jgi:hypothetical protein
MPEKQHWPFGSDADADKQRDLEQERLRRDEAAEARRRVRFDRLIVGGRAHARKRGLS